MPGRDRYVVPKSLLRPPRGLLPFIHQRPRGIKKGECFFKEWIVSQNLNLAFIDLPHPELPFFLVGIVSEWDKAVSGADDLELHALKRKVGSVVGVLSVSRRVAWLRPVLRLRLCRRLICRGGCRGLILRLCRWHRRRLLSVWCGCLTLCLRARSAELDDLGADLLGLTVLAVLILPFVGLLLPDDEDGLTLREIGIDTGLVPNLHIEKLGGLLDLAVAVLESLGHSYADLCDLRLPDLAHLGIPGAIALNDDLLVGHYSLGLNVRLGDTIVTFLYCS